MTTTTTTTTTTVMVMIDIPSSGDVVGAVSSVEEEVRAATTPALMGSSFALGETQDHVLKVEAGDVKIMSTSVPDKHVTLTMKNWARLMSIARRLTSKHERSIIRCVRWLIMRTLAIYTMCPWPPDMDVWTLVIFTFHTGLRASTCVLHAMDSVFASMSGYIY